MPNIGPLEIIVILLILLVVFGPRRVPELGRSVGQGIRNFKESVTGRDRAQRDQELEAARGAPPVPGASASEARPAEPPTDPARSDRA